MIFHNKNSVNSIIDNITLQLERHNTRIFFCQIRQRHEKPRMKQTIAWNIEQK